MTRARARALETEVTSLLSDISYDPLETWLLPQSGMLCMLRYQGTNLEEATAQDGHQEQEEELQSPEWAVLPLKPSGTTAEPSQAVLPLVIRPTSAEPDKLEESNGARTVLPPSKRYYR